MKKRNRKVSYIEEKPSDKTNSWFHLFLLLYLHGGKNIYLLLVIWLVTICDFLNFLQNGAGLKRH